jgi:hypothetical protein
MAEARYLPQSDYLGLKHASRQLVTHNGGPTDAAALTRADQPSLSRQIGNDPERYLALDVIADLEAACGQPIVTRKLAELADCLLIEISRRQKGDVLSQEAGLTAQAFGKLMSDFGSALVDGTVDKREAHEVRADIRHLLTALVRFDETLKAREKAK